MSGTEIYLDAYINCFAEENCRRHEELYALVEHNLIRSDELARDPDPIETERKLAGSRIILCTLSMLSNPFLDDASVYSFVPVERLVVDEASQINISEYMVRLGMHRYLVRI